ncbi:MAG: hypothetical protein MJ016_08790 [Victivallaceae bacterium]|nr:hypothetical protein [Victivallaceae bacterium]
MKKIVAVGKWFCRHPVWPGAAALFLMYLVLFLVWCNRLPYVFRWSAGRILVCGAWISGAGIVLLAGCGIAGIFKRKREYGCALLLLALGYAILTAWCLFGYKLYFYLGPVQDHFADRLKLPENVVLREALPPEDANIDFRKAPEDSFQCRVLSAVDYGAELDYDGELSLPALEALHRADPDNRKILQIFARNPFWRLHRDSPGGNYHATRRFCAPDGTIVSSRDGAYHYRRNSSRQPGASYCYRLDIRLDGRSWNGRLLRAGGEYSDEGSYHRSVSRVKADKILVEILEESPVPGRRMTAETLDLLEDEFSRIYDGTFVLPEDAVARGKPSISLKGARGNYTATLHCNPGEPGDLYLKAYEVTGNPPLSAAYLRRNANERIGFSSDPEELFFGQMAFTVYEGDWGQFYGARIEVWFVPEDSSKPERKLLEDNFRIEGWMRLD